jgi:serralysin
MATTPLDPVYEILAKELAYVFDNPAFSQQVNTGLALAGYKIDQQFVDATTGFQAIGLTSVAGDKPPVLVIRGADEALDDAATVNPGGIGLNQFTANKAAIGAWLTKVGTETVKPDVVGHSFGGALAQLTAAEFTSAIGNLVTFNSPGVNTTTVTQFQQSGGGSKNVVHYIVNGDLVSLAGQGFLPGTVVLQSFTDPAINPIAALDKHRLSQLLTKPPKGYQQTTITPQQLSDPTFNFNKDSDYAEFLAAYKVVEPKLQPALTSRQGVEALRVAPGSSFFGLIQAAQTKLAPDQNNLLVGDDQANTADGASGNDTIDGKGGDDVLRGGIGRDKIDGGAGKDSLFGDSGRDYLIGGKESDVLAGGDNHDMLLGVQLDDRRPGRGEIDRFTGGAGRDLFMLGAKKKVFYTDGKLSTAGVEDYAQITDLKQREGDRIQLAGKLNDYVLARTTGSLPKGVGIYLKVLGENELIGIVSNTSRLSIVEDAFKFVA